MPLTGDLEKMAFLAMMDIQGLSDSITHIGGAQVKGLNKFINEVRNGKLSDDSVDKFYRNVLGSVSSLKSAEGVELGPVIAKSLEVSITNMKGIFSEIYTDDPLKYREERILPPDFREFARFTTDATSASKRILKLLELSDKSLCLPALKDEFIAAFERVYKPVANHLNQFLNDGKMSKNKRYECVERILSLQWFIGKGTRTKSDIREIRNQFAHPDRIDCEDHYHIRVGDWVMDLYYQDLLNANDCFITKCMLVMRLANIILDLELLSRMLKK